MCSSNRFRAGISRGYRQPYLLHQRDIGQIIAHVRHRSRFTLPRFQQGPKPRFFDRVALLNIGDAQLFGSKRCHVAGSPTQNTEGLARLLPGFDS